MVHEMENSEFLPLESFNTAYCVRFVELSVAVDQYSVAQKKVSELEQNCEFFGHCLARRETDSKRNIDAVLSDQHRTEVDRLIKDIEIQAQNLEQVRIHSGQNERLLAERSALFKEEMKSLKAEFHSEREYFKQERGVNI